MRRRFLNIAAVVSPLLCVVFLGLWVRSHFALDGLELFAKGYGMKLCLPIGSLGILVHQTGPRDLGTIHYDTQGPRNIVAEARQENFDIWTVAGFAFGRFAPTYPDIHFVQIPLWFLAITTGVFPAIRLMGHRRERLTEQRQRRMNQCATCGYDLRATPDRCPECGTIPEQKKAVGNE